MKVIVSTTHGDLVLQLMPHVAPHFVSHFIKLCEKDYYIGIPFYRIVKNFMIQTGLNGNRLPDYKTHDWPVRCIDEYIGAEILHQKGFCNVANGGPQTQTSEWCVFDGTARWLTGKHTIFAVLINGYDTLEKIATIPVTTSPGWFNNECSKPTCNAIIENITLDIPMNDVTYQLEIRTKGYGIIRASLFHHAAPLTVKHFISLLLHHSDFYNDMPIHRIAKGFTLQTGRTPQSYSKTPISMFPVEETCVKLKHVRGSIASVKNTQGQICIFNRECQWLDTSDSTSDTIFGCVTHGFNVLDRLFQCETEESTIFKTQDGTFELSKPKSPILIHSIKINDISLEDFSKIYGL